MEKSNFSIGNTSSSIGNYSITDKEPNLTEIEPFNYLKITKMLLSKSENISLLLSMGKCWFKAQAMMLESKFTSKPELMQKAQIKMAKGIEHRFYDILKTFSEMTFGENVLVSTRNIGTKEVLRNEEDKAEYIKLRNLMSEKFKEKDLFSLLGLDETCINTEYLRNIEIFEPKSANRDGVCFSACMYTIGKLLNERVINEAALIRITSELHNGVPAKVAAIQQLYLDLQINEESTERIKMHESSKKIRSNFVNNIASTFFNEAIGKGFILNKQDIDSVRIVIENTINGLKKLDEPYMMNADFIDKETVLNSLCNSLEIDEIAAQKINPALKNTLNFVLEDLTSSKISANAQVVAHLYGFQIDPEGTWIARNILGQANDYPSTKDHLQNLMEINPGVYEIGFSTMDSRHAIFYVKTEDGKGHLMDPNYGLIKCDDPDHKSTFLKLLSLYPPPYDKMDNEDEDRNYRMYFNKCSKPFDINSPTLTTFHSENRIQENIEPQKIASNFLDSIKTISTEARLFVFVQTDEKFPQLVEYLFFDDKKSPNIMLVKGLDGSTFGINVSDITGLEVIPRLGNIIADSDKEKLQKIGITFDTNGFICIPKDKFIYEKKMQNNVIKINISDQKGQGVVEIESKICADKNTCSVYWT